MASAKYAPAGRRGEQAGLPAARMAAVRQQRQLAANALETATSLASAAAVEANWHRPSPDGGRACGRPGVVQQTRRVRGVASTPRPQVDTQVRRGGCWFLRSLMSPMSNSCADQQAEQIVNGRR